MRESCAIAKYLFLGSITKEVPGRMYNDNEMWDIDSNCTVGLTAESKRERAVRAGLESQTEEEALLDQFTGDLFSGTNASGGANNTNSNVNNNGDDKAGKVEEILEKGTMTILTMEMMMKKLI